jgi:hypothetical protein
MFGATAKCLKDEDRRTMERSKFARLVVFNQPGKPQNGYLRSGSANTYIAFPLDG